MKYNGNVGSWKFTPDEEDKAAIESGQLFEGAQHAYLEAIKNDADWGFLFYSEDSFEEL